ncbi:MAG TPA: hypothetical protein VK540_28725, partial [Polyangiaceae bacterium]|nr:hypothetical protein [Polyangiaceae bacterium]
MPTWRELAALPKRYRVTSDAEAFRQLLLGQPAANARAADRLADGLRHDASISLRRGFMPTHTQRFVGQRPVS